MIEQSHLCLKDDDGPRIVRFFLRRFPCDVCHILASFLVPGDFSHSVAIVATSPAVLADWISVNLSSLPDVFWRGDSSESNSSDSELSDA